MIDKPGVYEISNEEYHKDPCIEPSLSRGTIRELDMGVPYRAWYEHPRLNPDFVVAPEEAKFDIGNFGHQLFLEGIDKVAVIDAADWRTKVAKEQREVARAEGKIPMLAEQYERCRLMVEMAHERLAGVTELGITNLHNQGDSELSYFWQEDDIWCRARLDWISKDRTIILDTKFTGQSASPNTFDRLIEPMGLDIQYAWYRRAVRALEGVEPNFVFFVIETEPPYLACPISLTPEYAELGESKVRQGLNRWRKCLKENYWPSYPNRICYLEPKPWVLSSWNEKLGQALEQNGGTL